MNAKHSMAKLVLGLALSHGLLYGQQDIGSAFTYQGAIENGSGPVTDTCDFRLGLWDAEAAGNQVGMSPQTVGAVDVVDGTFTVGVDFSAGAINGTARWLEIEVQCPGDAGFTLLSPRVELTPAPHALALPGLYTQQNVTSPNIIGGYGGNFVTTNVVGATISGGGTSGSPNSVTKEFGTVGGGRLNTAGGIYSTIGGGFNNYVTGTCLVGPDAGEPCQIDSDCSIPFCQNSVGATVGGGQQNEVLGNSATIGGGTANRACGQASTVGGGTSNSASEQNSTIGGGFTNAASGQISTVGGGQTNTASGSRSTIGGGINNTAKGSNSTVPGGSSNQAGGDYSFAAGQRAKIRDATTVGDFDGDEGTFIWADSTAADFVSTGPNQFLIRAGGGVGIGTNAPTDPLTVNGIIRSMTGGFELPDGTIIDAASNFGDITAVNAGTGLTGGGTSGSVTLNVAFAGTGAANTSARSDHFHSTLAASDGSPSNAVTVDAAGRVGINNSPDTNYQLNVAGTSGIQIIAVGGSSFGLNAINTGSGGTGVIGSTTIPSGVNYGVRGNSASPSGFDFFAMGAGTDYGSSSSIRWKSNIRPIDNPLDKLARLRGVYYDWDADHGGHHDVGMIAEEVGAVLPEIVAYEENGVDAIGLDYSKLSPLLIEAVKALQARVEHLEAEQRSTPLMGEMISAGAPIVLVGLVGLAALRRRNNKGDNQ